VLASVELYDQLGVDAAEVGDIPVNRKLGTELEAIELARAKRPPEPRLDIRLIAP
jgi:hypothetical protein